MNHAISQFVLRWLAVLVIGVCGSTAFADTLRGPVVGVKDGDTISVLIAGKAIAVRLSDIDAPELKGQAFAASSKQSLSELVFNQQVELDIIGRDTYGRTIARVRRGDLDVNLEQVRRGYAWAYRKYTRDPAILAAESNARLAAMGLWRDSEQTPPWEFRHATAVTPARPSVAQDRSHSVPARDLSGFFPDKPDYAHWNRIEHEESERQVVGTALSLSGSSGSSGTGTVHTGPRGGRYTISGSGSKSYLGHGSRR